MKRKAHIILLVLLLLCVLSTTAFAIDESEVESAIAASSKEEVAGNVFIWFLCAIGFLKVSQKIDSFMASLGINVGRTGGSMLTELMVAGRGIAAVAGAVGGTVFNHHSSSNSTHTNAQAAGAAFTGGGNGLVGVTRRAAGNAAAASATGNAKGLSNLVGGAMFESSLQNGGKFAMSVVGAVAKGSISSVGSITGDQAAEALTSYLGYSPVDSGSALADDGGLIPPSPITSEDVVTLDGGTAAGTASPTASANGTPIPSGAREHDGSVVESARISGAPPIFQNVEIGGGRITGLEVSPDRQSDREFAMYSTEQYMAPTGPYDTVQTVDGASWYRQYAQPKVEKTPYTSETIDPPHMAQWAYEHGYWCSGNGSYRSLIPGAAQAWSLSVDGCTASEPQRIIDALAEGKLVVALMTKGHFTSSGHFIVLRGCTSDGKILVADPSSYKRSEKSWDMSIILNEASKRAGSGGPFWIIGN